MDRDKKEEIIGAVIGITLVLCTICVFAFLVVKEVGENKKAAASRIVVTHEILGFKKEVYSAALGEYAKYYVEVVDNDNIKLYEISKRFYDELKNVDMATFTIELDNIKSIMVHK